MATFKIDVNDGDVTAALSRLIAANNNPAPALKAIGEALVAQTKRSFETGTDPWGRRWAPNAPATIAAMLARRSGKFAAYSDIATRKGKQARVGTKDGYFRQDGRLGAKGSAAVMAKRPLIGESRQLSMRIHYDVQGNTLVVGSPMVQAAMQQLGGLKSRFPKLWGDIPARPFLPVTAAGELSPEARRTVVDVIQEALLGQK